MGQETEFDSPGPKGCGYMGGGCMIFVAVISMFLATASTMELDCRYNDCSVPILWPVFLLVWVVFVLFAVFMGFKKKVTWAEVGGGLFGSTVVLGITAFMDLHRVFTLNFLCLVVLVCILIMGYQWFREEVLTFPNSDDSP
jgi:hypothetical protein